MLNIPKSFSLILKRLNYGLLSFMLLWKKIRFPCTLDAGKTEGKYFLSELFFLGSEMDFRQSFAKVFALWKSLTGLV